MTFEKIISLKLRLLKGVTCIYSPMGCLVFLAMDTPVWKGPSAANETHSGMDSNEKQQTLLTYYIANAGECKGPIECHSTKILW